MKWIKSLVMNAGHDGRLVITRDAAHSFPPDGGQGLDSALKEIAIIAAALSSMPEDASVPDAISDCEERGNDDISGVVKLATIQKRK